jgi:chemotaxis protein MotB
MQLPRFPSRLLVVSLLSLAACGDGETKAGGTEGNAPNAELEAANAKVAELEKAVADLTASAAAAGGEVGALKGKVDTLKGEKGQLEGQLEEKKRVLETIAAVESELTRALIEEVKAGDIRVSQRGGYLVVGVSDKVLFQTGKAELKPRGQKVLEKLAASLLTLPEDQIFQVGGHTDNAPIKSEAVKENFPTNWELSSARATNVVRYLEESCAVPGKRLMAAGFSEHRPVASNKKGKGRKKNRRIEIALLPAPKD